MKEFDPIWFFVEKKYNVEVPSYVKNILHACGFNNGITIASIDHEDMQYFVDETRNGNVVKFFKNYEDVDEDSVLQGTSFPAAEFEFTRGHKKLLLSIVGYLKKHMEENGPNNFTLKTAPKKKTAKDTTNNTVRRVSRKKKFDPLIDPLIEFALAEVARIEEHSEELVNEAMKIHKKTLLKKSIKALGSNTSELVAQNVELIKEKISNDLVMVYITEDENTEGAKVKPKKETWGYYAVIGCPYCGTTINVFQTSSATWGTTNFDRHLRLVHPRNPPNHVDNSDANIEVTGSATDNIENDNIETSIASDSIETDCVKEMDVVPTTEKSKKNPKKSLLTSKSNSLLLNKATKSLDDIPLDVNKEADDELPEKNTKKKLKKPEKKPFNQEKNCTLLTPKPKHLLSDKATKSIVDISLDVNEEADDELPEKNIKKKLKKPEKNRFNQEKNGTLLTPKPKPVLLNKATKRMADIPLDVNDKAVKADEPPEKKSKKKLKKSFNGENKDGLQTSKSKALLSDKKTKSNAFIPLDVNDGAVKTDDEPLKKKAKKQLKKTEENLTSKPEVILSKKKKKKFVDIPLEGHAGAVKTDGKHIGKYYSSMKEGEPEGDGVKQEQKLQAETLTSPPSVIVNHSERNDEKKFAKRKEKLRHHSSHQKQLENNWRKYW